MDHPEHSLQRWRNRQKHTTAGIRWSSPTQLLIRPSPAYLWESGRDPEFSGGYGRMWKRAALYRIISTPFRRAVSKLLPIRYGDVIRNLLARSPSTILIHLSASFGRVTTTGVVRCELVELQHQDSRLPRVQTTIART
ncbi:hypothetical protein B0J15DRAFT_230198 [Fusarium solani]|uniref:Uncharacterized protein n=1 Tax=Fusarium solani TaxID=169388 RepID=A0A9P9KTM0_FUSSL|nr:uncharacterized protein B0J15DRAFT_230198 [Fusarium solani]KAH7268292.1 hypothetical protein B0J15DRAFT_230198 [Fusarium solani]